MITMALAIGWTPSLGEFEAMHPRDFATVIDWQEERIAARRRMGG